MTDQNDIDAPTSHAAGHFAFDAPMTGALEAEVRLASTSLARTLSRYGSASEAQRAGHAAEAWHAATLNADAVRKGLPIRSHTTAATGNPHAAADVVSRGPGVLVEGQIKTCGTPAVTATSLARPRYHGMQQVVPADQLVGVREHARRSADRLASSNPGRAAAFEETSRRATDRLTAGGAESRPLGHAEAQELVTRPERLASAMRDGLWKRDLARGATAGAVTAGVISAAVHGHKLVKGELALSDALAEVAAGTGKGALRGAATGVGARMVGQGLAKCGLGAAARTAAPVAIAATAIDVGGHVVDYARGRVSGIELAAASGKSIATGAAGWAGAEIGAGLGTLVCPGVGTVLGGVVGSILGVLGVGRLFR